jgi:hypothetical protein
MGLFSASHVCIPPAMALCKPGRRNIMHRASCSRCRSHHRRQATGAPPPSPALLAAQATKNQLAVPLQGCHPVQCRMSCGTARLL